MTHFIKAFIAGSAFIAVAGAASAKAGQAAVFTYTPSAPVHVIYAEFQTSAHRACRIGLAKAGGVSMKAKIEKSCEAQMVANAAKATERQDLLAYHAQATSPRAATTQLADRH
ncbi:MAG: hypothetical protein KKC43_11100 [Alphaproteobacteria bacterium]|nr:hypothetical protein [Alphaproteobacteria bacterium]